MLSVRVNPSLDYNKGTAYNNTQILGFGHEAAVVSPRQKKIRVVSLAHVMFALSPTSPPPTGGLSQPPGGS